MPSDSQLLRSLADKEDIRDCLYRYSRGIDRFDPDLVRSAYWPDVEARQLTFEGDAEAFIAWAFPMMQALDLIWHHIGNILIRIDGDAAIVESGFMSYRRMELDGEKRDQFGGGRYLDRFERRDGEWRIAKRLVVVDWSRPLPPSAELAAMPVALDKRRPDDVSYEWLGAR